MELMESTNGLLLFLAYLGTAAALTLAYIVIYMCCLLYTSDAADE